MNFNEIWFILNQTALYLAVEMNNIEIVKLLLTKDNVDIDFNTINIYKKENIKM